MLRKPITEGSIGRREEGDCPVRAGQRDCEEEPERSGLGFFPMEVRAAVSSRPARQTKATTLDQRNRLGKESCCRLRNGAAGTSVAPVAQVQHAFSSTLT